MLSSQSQHHHHHHRLFTSNFLLSPFTSPSFFVFRPTTLRPLTVSAHLHTTSGLIPWLAAQLPEPEGPIELPSSITSVISTDDNPTTLQVATSLLLTGSIAVLLFRSLRRRANRAKQLRFRSSGAQKTLKEEAMESLKAMTTAPLQANSPPSPVQALLGGLSAGAIALILYKFATTVEASLNQQTLSDNFSVRQITITIRTIINGICYLATCIFGINSVGLVLYSAQLAFNSIVGGSLDAQQDKDDKQLSSTNTSPEVNSSDEDKGPDSMQ